MAFNVLVSDHFLNAHGHFVFTYPPSVFKRPSDINQVEFSKKKNFTLSCNYLLYPKCFGRQTHISSRSFKTKLACLLNGLIKWLNPREGKKKRILFSDWLPEREKWTHLACSGFPAFVPQGQLLFLCFLAI